MRHMTWIGALAAVALMASGCAQMGMGSTVPLKAELTGASEVPPVPTPARGMANMTYDPGSKQLKWKVDYSGLSADGTAAHFHGPAAPGANAGVVVPIAMGAAMKSPLEGAATLTDAQAADLLAGRWYVNVHSRNHAGGEIRGQAMRAQ